jgi:TetR/AcrR family transcriptional regulator, transcriptional repressor for nem operon
MSISKLPRPPGRPRSFDDQVVVGAAMDVFWRDGYAGASLPDISAATGLSTSSLYNAYGSKLGLFVAALDAYLDGVMGFMLGPLEHGSGGLAEVDGFLDRLAATAAVDPPRGCLAVNTIGEFRDAPPEVAERTRRYRALLRRSLRAALRRAAALGEIPEGSATRRADAIAPIVVAFNLLVASCASARDTRELLRAARAIAHGD